jgi:plastocyanin
MATQCWAHDLKVQISSLDNKPIADAVVYIEATEESVSQSVKLAVMDQQNKAFVPHVLAVTAGTTVEFPNTDSVNHYVYSFSEIKKFQFKLFKGDLEKHQILLDKPGLITIGCNIHDFMLGYIFVAPTPYVGVTDVKGEVTLSLPDKGEFQLAIWHERANEDLSQITQKIIIESANQSVRFRMTKALKPQRKMSHEGENY